jgi:sugar/nucleoside kinase (ribokinase family)
VIRLDVVGIGNALVDVLSHESEEFVVEHDLERGAMQLIDTARAEHLYAAMSPATEISGGSAANTMVGIASFGGKAAFVGRVNDDQLGNVFGHDLRAAGVEYLTPAAHGGEPTGRCLIVVTPDAERTLNTYLGASAKLGPDDLDDELVASAQVLYLEGYLWDEPDAKDAFRRAVRVAHDAGNRVAFTLSDAFCVDRHREEFLDLVEHEVDVLFANEAEITSLYEVDEFDDALQRVHDHCEISTLTRSEKGAVIVTRDEVHVVDAHPVTALVDTTGAGDLYAAGFLYGLTHGYDLGTAGRLGALAASEVISHLGPRPQVSLAELARPLLEPRSR